MCSRPYEPPVTYAGQIQSNKAISPEAKEIIKEVLFEIEGQYVLMSDKILFKAYTNDFKLSSVLDNLKPLGYTFSGIIDYSGEYNGRIFVMQSTIRSYDKNILMIYGEMLYKEYRRCA